MRQGDVESTDETDAQLNEPIQLDDVFDTTFLSSDVPAPPDSTPIAPVVEPMETEPSDSVHGRHVENLNRWDHIPINAFRKTREMGGVDDELHGRLNVMTRTSQAPRPSDGFSYGSAMGGMLCGSPLNTALWESTSSSPFRDEQTQAKMDSLTSLLLSPVLLPSRDDNRTPTNDKQVLQQHMLDLGSSSSSHRSIHHAANLKTRKEMRKEKKRNRKFFSNAPAHTQHKHFPNAKGRSSGSMQRSSSVPSLNP